MLWYHVLFLWVHTFLVNGHETKLNFLSKNTLDSGLPLSYKVEPKDYFRNVPENLKPKAWKHSQKAPQCNGDLVTGDKWAAYEFQTEEMLTAVGLNIYDGSLWTIAMSIVGQKEKATSFYEKVLLPAKTLQLANIRGANPCKGVQYWNECEDPDSTGVCGLCYGDGDSKTLPPDQAWFFRMISDYYGLMGTVLALCPEKNYIWTWNDWRPVLGENAWATLTGPLGTVYLRAGLDAKAIPDDSPEMKLASTAIPSIMAMRAGDSGGIYYAPRNVYAQDQPNIGSSISTENQASLYAGLKSFEHILKSNPASAHAGLLGDIQTLMAGIEKFLKAAYDPDLGYFRQGATYDPKTKKLTWIQGEGIPEFAVDCQTWVSSVLGSDLIDSWYGSETTYKIWNATKDLAGYAKQPDGMVKGVGYSNNEKDQVFSGEWTYGAINWLKIMAEESSYDSNTKARLQKEASFMEKAIKDELAMEVTMADGSVGTGVKYSNKRYFIPFGWWANPIPSLASTAWSIMADHGWNPLMLNGKFASKYD